MSNVFPRCTGGLAGQDAAGPLVNFGSPGSFDDSWIFGFRIDERKHWAVDIRGQLIPLRKSAGETRVLFLGDSATEGAFVSLAPSRILDTRSGVGTLSGRPAAGATVDVTVVGGAVPADATAVVLNVVATDATRTTVAVHAEPGAAMAWCERLGLESRQLIRESQLDLTACDLDLVRSWLAPAGAIEAWIVAHGGEPEVPLIRTSRLGLHDRTGGAVAVRPPRRYVLPVTALELAS